MKVLVLDFETYFSDDYTLKNLTTEAYVRDARFSAHMVGVWRPAENPTPGDFLPALLESNAGVRAAIEDSAVLCHHAHFDGLILAHHYGLKPRFWLDTLSMSRLVLPRLRSHSLDALARYFDLAAKSVPYHLFRGVRDLPPALYGEVAAGCRHDVALTYAIFQKLLPVVPKEELQVIDTTVRMFTEPCLRLDRPRMASFLQAEKIRKAKSMLAAGEALGMPPFTAQNYSVDIVKSRLALIETELQSSAKFQAALEAIGYACPTKWSDKASAQCDACEGFGQVRVVEAGNVAALDICGTCHGLGKIKGGYIPALAKSDDGMKELLEHDDPRVQALAAARLGVKSTIDETRAERLLDADTRGPLPVYLAYAAAKTLRYGGGDKTNWQNFRRGGEIRKSIMAPEGHKLVIGDLSQIEYRLLLWLTGQNDKLDALAGGRDLYCEFATDFYGEPVTKADKPRRGVGKQGILMSGYGAGKGTMIATAAGGGYGPPVLLSDAEGQRMVDLYRSTHPCVPQFWKWCEWALPVLASGGETEYRVGARAILRIAKHKIWLPNDTALDYTGLKKARNTEIFPDQQWDGEQPCWWEPNRKGWGRIWGSKTTADIVQALARVVIIAALVRIAQRYRVVLQVHDEVVAVVPAAEAEEACAWVEAVMKAPLSWCPDIPLEAEVIHSEIYEK